MARSPLLANASDSGASRFAAEVSSAICHSVVLFKNGRRLNLPGTGAVAVLWPSAHDGLSAVPRETFGRVAAGGRFHVKRPDRGIIANRAILCERFT
jgi:hypothetical protein